MSTSRWLMAAVLFWALLSAPSGQEPQARSGSVPRRSDPRPTTSLRPDPVALTASGDRHTLASGERRVHELFLDVGEFVRVVVDVQGSEVVVRLWDPDGDELLRLKAPDDARSPAHLEVVAARSGRHRLEIRARKRRPGGTYRVDVGRPRPARAGERRRAEAARLFARAESLSSQPAPGPQRSLAAYQQALELWEAVDERRSAALVRFRLAEAHFTLRRLEPALRFYEQALAAYRELKDERAQARVLAWMGPALRRAGRPQDAERRYREALSLAERAGDPEVQADAFLNLGALKASQGMGDAALDAYEQALRIWRRLGVQDREANVLSDMGSAYTLLGRSNDAAAVLESALAVRRASRDVRGQADALIRMGTAQSAAEHSGAALETFAEAIRLFQELGDPEGVAVASQRRGWALLKEGRPREAVRTFEQVLSFFRERRLLLDEAASLGSLAAALVAAGEPERAHRASRQALGLVPAHENRLAEASVRLTDARALAALGRLAEAEAQIDTAMALVEQGRTQVRGVALRQSYFAVRQEYYEFAVELQMRLHTARPGAGHLARALELAERGRARGLLDRLAADPNIEGGVEDDEALGAEINALDLRRFELLRAGAAPQAVTRVERQLGALLRQRDRTDGRIATGGDLRPPDLAAMRRLLDDQTTVLFYDLGRKRSFLWRLTSRALTAYELPGRARIEQLARRAHSLLPRSYEWAMRKPARQSLARLSRTILGPVSDDLRGQRLLVVPDGALHYVPFAALPLGDGDGEPPLAGSDASSDGRPLVNKFEVVTLPSLAALAGLRRAVARRRPASRGLAVVADPVFEPDDPRLDPAVDQVVAEEVVADGSSDLTRSARSVGLARFDRLPFTRIEARAILAAAPQTQGLGAMGFEASRAMVVSGRLRDYRFLHFATHGLLNTEHPDLSGLVLSRYDRHGRPIDGFLRVHEIHALDLTADLVTLSACRTALGKEVRGEGLVGMTQAFLHAGAARVLVSLWNVSDRATAELMRRFYGGLLRRGLAPGQALRDAQLELRRDPRFRAPYHWAGFVLQGDWRS